MEEHELGVRHTASRELNSAIVLWLRQLRLFYRAFMRTYDLSTITSSEERQSVTFRLDLLGLAGGNSKLALDAMFAGHYTGCMAVERHILETWRRVAYARLSNEDIWRWYPQDYWPDGTVPTPEGTMPTKNPDAKRISQLIDDRGSDTDKKFRDIVRDGFDILSDHSHPTIEGATQTWDPENSERRFFGASYSRIHSQRCLKWGLSSNAMLLYEVSLVAPQDAGWTSELAAMMSDLSTVLTTIQEQ